MIALSANTVQDIQKRFKAKIEVQYNEAIKGLEALSALTIDSRDKIFVDQILTVFKDNNDLLTLTPDKFDVLKTKIGSVPFDEVYEKGKMKPVKREIKDKIIEKLGYKNLRKSFYPEYFAAIGIKACVYCNSQLTVSVVSKDGKFSGRFDVDHYHSKDDFPWLSICLFNLYPSCASCNRRKSTNSIEFELYAENIDRLSKSEYSFKLDPFAKAKYMISKDYNDIAFIFKEPIYAKNIKSFEDTFKITGIYNTQLDVVEELMAKSQMYDVTFRKVLSDNFSKLGINKTVYDRIILGNYVEENEIHKRPMSKFMQDIAKDLRLLK